MKNQQPSEAKRESDTPYLCIKDYVMYSGEIGFVKGKTYFFDEDLQTQSELFSHDMKSEPDFDLHFKIAQSPDDPIGNHRGNQNYRISKGKFRRLPE